jgi:oligosaccharyltransferase complex subunit delta (ribophorin II)
MPSFSAALLLCLSSVDAEALSDVFSPHDITRIRDLLLSTEPYGELSTPYHVLRGLQALGTSSSENEDRFKKSACAYAISHIETTSDLQSLFYISSIAAELGSSCLPDFVKKKSHIQSVVSEALESEQTMEKFYYSTSINTNLGLGVNSESVLASVLTALDDDETIQNTALAFLTASQLPDVDLTAIYDLVEDVVAQADETPTTLYYDSLETTSNVITGIFAMATTTGEAPAITSEQATKFGNYLLTNTYTVDVARLAYVLAAAIALDRNEYVVPCSLLLTSSGYVSRANPDIQVRLATILGSPPPTEFTVTVMTVTHQEGDETSPKKKLKSENGIYSYNLFQEVSSPGVYTLTFSTESVGGSPVVKLTETPLQVTISFEVTIGSAELSLSDREHGTTAKKISLEYPNSSKETLEADQHSKVVMKFTLVDKETKKSALVHQAFVRLTRGQHEIFFVATANKKTLQYTFELDMVTAAEDFGSLSGSYAMSLIVGDFALENPFSWDIGSVTLQFAGSTTDTGDEEDYTYRAKPEIQHMFRPDEKRPPKVISSTFTVLVLSPLALLLVLWVGIGFNVSGLGTGGLWAVVFHISLGGIFVVYYLFWWKLNMFDTMKLLALLSVPTFLAGNRMLKRIASSNQ